MKNKKNTKKNLKATIFDDIIQKATETPPKEPQEFKAAIQNGDGKLAEEIRKLFKNEEN